MKTNSVTATPRPSSVEDRALALLGSGIPAARVAEALGIDPSRISQLISDDDFKVKLADAKFDYLNKHNEADAELDAIEAKVRSQLLETIDSVYKPLELTRILQVVNASKRRGSSAPAAITEQHQILNLTMPVKIVNNFTTNVNNQVIKAGDTELLTMQSSSLNAMLSKQAAVLSKQVKDDKDNLLTQSRLIESDERSKPAGEVTANG